jgi:hypothetical protein
LQAKAAFWLVVGLELLVFGVFRSWSNWAGLLLITLPAAAWYLWMQKRALQSVMVVFLNKLAGSKGLVKLQTAESKPLPKPAVQKNP